MTIQFYTAEDHIYTMFDAKSNPFKTGDSINLTVEDIAERDFSVNNPDFIAPRMYIPRLVKANRQRKELYHNKRIKLVQEEMHLDLETGDFTIVFYCEFEHQ